MFHRKRHHHHHHPRSNSSSRANPESDPTPTDLDNGSSSLSSQYTLQTPTVRRRSTSPVCPKTVELAAAAVEPSASAFRMPDHSPSPVRRHLIGGSQSPRGFENNVNSSSMPSFPSSPSSSLTGLFRRKRSPMELAASQSFSAGKSNSSSPSKPLPPPKPHRLNASSAAMGEGGEPLKGRSLSPLPSSHMLTAKMIGSIHSVSLDLGQSHGDSTNKKTKVQQLPTLVLNAANFSNSEPTSPSISRETRQKIPSYIFYYLWNLENVYS